MIIHFKNCCRILSLGLGMAAGALVIWNPVAQAQTNLQYQLPPQAIVDIVEALPTPGVELSPAGGAAGKRWLFAHRPALSIHCGAHSRVNSFVPRTEAA